MMNILHQKITVILSEQNMEVLLMDGLIFS
ncbi:MAG: hypothetical protein ACI94Y_003182 [Maribacter sp.]|jgi:hypothetical protein